MKTTSTRSSPKIGENGSFKGAGRPGIKRKKTTFNESKQLSSFLLVFLQKFAFWICFIFSDIKILFKNIKWRVAWAETHVQEVHLGQVHDYVFSFCKPNLFYNCLPFLFCRQVRLL